MDRPGKIFICWEVAHKSPAVKMRTLQPYTEPWEEQVHRGTASTFPFHKMRQSEGRLEGENTQGIERIIHWYRHHCPSLARTQVSCSGPSVGFPSWNLLKVCANLVIRFLRNQTTECN